MKGQGPIWLGLTDRARSLRPYGGLDDIGRMVARSAYAQLGFSPWRLAGTVLAMAIVYLAAPLLAVFAGRPRPLVWPGGLAGHGHRLPAHAALLPPLAGLGRALPLIVALYTLFTSSPPCAPGKAAAACGRAAPRPWRRRHERPMRPTSLRARITATRTFRWPRCSSPRAIAPSSWPSIRVARMADDIADHPSAGAGGQARTPGRHRSHSLGRDDAVAPAANLRRLQDERGLSRQHILDLIEAFRRDVVKTPLRRLGTS